VAPRIDASGEPVQTVYLSCYWCELHPDPEEGEGKKGGSTHYIDTDRLPLGIRSCSFTVQAIGRRGEWEEEERERKRYHRVVLESRTDCPWVR